MDTVRECKKLWAREYRKTEKSRQQLRGYRERNRERIGDYQKRYQKTNLVRERERKKLWAREYRKKKVECECGQILLEECLSRHRSTVKHIRNFILC